MGVEMEVPETEAFVLHEKRIKNFADMARNLNPLSHDDFLNHKNNVITWVEHSGKDYYLAEKLKETKSKDKFVELLALRNKKEEARNARTEIETNNYHELKNVERKLNSLEEKEIIQKKKAEIKTEPVTKIESNKEEVVLPKKSFDKIQGVDIEFDFDDFIKLIEEAEHAISHKDYNHAVNYYKKLKDKFETSKLDISQKKELHNKIKELYKNISDSVN